MYRRSSRKESVPAHRGTSYRYQYLCASPLCCTVRARDSPLPFRYSRIPLIVIPCSYRLKLHIRLRAVVHTGTGNIEQEIFAVLPGKGQEIPCISGFQFKQAHIRVCEGWHSLHKVLSLHSMKKAPWISPRCFVSSKPYSNGMISS